MSKKEKLLDIFAVLLFILGLLFIYEAKRSGNEDKDRIDKLQLALNAAGAGRWYWDVNRNELYWDDKMFELFDAEKQDNLSVDYFFDHVHAEDKEGIRKYIMYCVEHEMNYSAIYRTTSNKLIVAHGKFEDGVLGGICKRFPTFTYLPAELTLEELTNDYGFIHPPFSNFEDRELNK